MWEHVFAWLAVLAGVAAALLWFVACRVRVEYRPHVDADDETSASVTLEDADGQRIDPFATADLSSRWNARAAAVTAVAALLQAAALGAQQLHL